MIKEQNNNDMKTYTLPFSKVSNPISYDQVKELTAFDNLKAIPSTSQVTKRMDEEMFEEILTDLNDGIEIEIKG